MTTICVFLSISFQLEGHTLTQTYETDIKTTQFLIDEVYRQGGKVLDADIRQIECKAKKKSVK